MQGASSLMQTEVIAQEAIRSRTPAADRPLRIQFVKMSGTGNDFVMIDNRKTKFTDTDKRKIVSLVCPRRTSVGADGTIFLEEATLPEHDFRMRYYNADGGEAEMCGNGSRCVAVFARRIGAAGLEQRIQTMAGTVDATVLDEGASARVRLSQPSSMDMHAGLTVEGHPVDIYSVNTGVPHAVEFVEDVSNIDVVRRGADLRRHPAFLPQGTNANFAQVMGPGELRVRTYERGVEDETLACGTGATACAIAAALVHGCRSPVRVHIASGDTLTIHFELKPDLGTSAPPLLEGAVKRVFDGVLECSPGSVS